MSPDRSRNPNRSWLILLGLHAVALCIIYTFGLHGVLVRGMCACAAMVFLFAMGISQQTTSRKASDTREDRPPPDAPAPFETRLARFLHCDQDALARAKPERPSQMKFWCMVRLDRRYAPKPAWLIRRILLRIHRLVHG